MELPYAYAPTVNAPVASAVLVNAPGSSPTQIEVGFVMPAIVPPLIAAKLLATTLKLKSPVLVLNPSTTMTYVPAQSALVIADVVPNPPPSSSNAISVPHPELYNLKYES